MCPSLLDNLTFRHVAVIVRTLFFGLWWMLRRDNSALLKAVEIPLGKKLLPENEVESAAQAAFFLLKYLPFGNFACLFRSVALCRELRRHGIDARVSLLSAQINGENIGHARVASPTRTPPDDEKHFIEICSLPK